jgi:hypothetical protein
MVWAIVWFFVAGLAEGLQWFLEFRTSESMGPRFFIESSFWNPVISWMNKWQDPWAEFPRERFWLSSRHLVWLTDGFHLAQFVRTMSLIIGLCGLVAVWQAILLMLVFKVGFTATFNIPKGN